MTTELNQKKSKPKVSSRGGARKGAGRPKGTRNKITVQDLLEAIDTQTGQPYEVLLIQDFIAARQGNDNGVVTSQQDVNHHDLAHREPEFRGQKSFHGVKKKSAPECRG